MSSSGADVPIQSRDFWFKVVDMLQQNWALIDETPNGGSIYFVHDRSGVFDRIEVGSVAEAASALARNGFRRFAADLSANSFLSPPLLRPRVLLGLGREPCSFLLAHASGHGLPVLYVKHQSYHYRRDLKANALEALKNAVYEAQSRPAPAGT